MDGLPRVTLFFAFTLFALNGTSSDTIAQSGFGSKNGPGVATPPARPRPPHRVSKKKVDSCGVGVLRRLEVFRAQGKRTRLAISLDVGEKSCVDNIPYVFFVPP